MNLADNKKEDCLSCWTEYATKSIEEWESMQGEAYANAVIPVDDDDLKKYAEEYAHKNGLKTV